MKLCDFDCLGIYVFCCVIICCISLVALWVCLFNDLFGVKARVVTCWWVCLLFLFVVVFVT